MAEDNWWTTPLEDEDGNMILVTGRSDVQKFRSNPRFSIRVELTLPYEADENGLPTKAGSQLIDEVLQRIQEQLRKDPVAVITGIYTGAGIRNLIFYTPSTFILDKKINAALADMPQLPITMKAENDPEWAEYEEMKELSEIN